jgi:hypothetical protein
MNTIQQINNVIAEIEGWNNGDKETFNAMQDGAVPFDGNFIFVARQKKIDRLKELLEKLQK